MNIWVLVLVFPTALCGIIHNKNFHNDLTMEDIEELKYLKTLTTELAESGSPPENLGKNTLEVEKTDVSFYIYNREINEAQQILLEEAQNITSVSSFDPNLRTVVLIHGWRNDYNSSFDTLVNQSYLEVRDLNIICVDWDQLAHQIYVLSFQAVPSVGHLVGQFINNLSSANDYPLSRISLVGHSLGAHICGFAGQETNGLLHSIIGLDPAGPLYFESEPDLRLSKDDAKYVQAIHTDAQLLGVNYNLGHADFWPNGGFSQPGCPLDITGVCSHGRSYELFTESLSSDLFIAKECTSYENYKVGACKDSPPTIMGGFHINTTIKGTYYLDTDSVPPYALGYTNL